MAGKGLVNSPRTHHGILAISEDRDQIPEPTQIHMIASEEIADANTAGEVAIDLFAIIAGRARRLTAIALARLATLTATLLFLTVAIVGLVLSMAIATATSRCLRNRVTIAVAIALEALLRAERTLGFLRATIADQGRFVKNAINQLGVGIAVFVRIRCRDVENATGNLDSVSFEWLLVITACDFDQQIALFFLDALVAGSQLRANSLGNDQRSFGKILELVKVNTPTVKDGQNEGFASTTLWSELKNETHKRIFLLGRK